MTLYAFPNCKEPSLPRFSTHMARKGYLRNESGEPALDFPLAAADAVRFEPMDFCFIDFTRVFANGRKSFHFTPALSAISLAKVFRDPYALTCRDYFGVADGAEHLKTLRLHCAQCPFPKNVLIES